jgi:hypothetical protein
LAFGTATPTGLASEETPPRHAGETTTAKTRRIIRESSGNELFTAID